MTDAGAKNNGSPGGKARHKAESYDRGVRAERWAGWIMRAKGFEILTRRYRAQGGEIDLVCRCNDLLVFLEVKYRTRLDDALFSITPRNQSRIIAAASAYLAERPDATITSYRFDVMAFAKGPKRVPLWNHLEGAFDTF